MPRIIPACVIAGVVIVGDCETLGDATPVGSIAFARPKSSTFTVPSGRTLMFAGFKIAMDDALLVRRFQRVSDLLRDGQRLVDRDRPARDALREVLALDEFHHERADAAGFFETVDVGDVRMVQRGQGPGLALKPRDPLRVGGERLGQDLDRDGAIQLRVPRAVDFTHAAGAERRQDLVRAEACAGG